MAQTNLTDLVIQQIAGQRNEGLDALALTAARFGESAAKLTEVSAQLVNAKSDVTTLSVQIGTLQAERDAAWFALDQLLKAGLVPASADPVISAVPGFAEWRAASGKV
jgi:hypothetical protein